MSCQTSILTHAIPWPLLRYVWKIQKVISVTVSYPCKLLKKLYLQGVSESERLSYQILNHESLWTYWDSWYWWKIWFKLKYTCNCWIVREKKILGKKCAWRFISFDSLRKFTKYVYQFLKNEYFSKGTDKSNGFKIDTNLCVNKWRTCKWNVLWWLRTSWQLDCCQTNEAFLWRNRIYVSFKRPPRPPDTQGDISPQKPLIYLCN